VGVFVSEGFPLALARKLRDNIMAVQSDAPLQIARGRGAGLGGSESGLTDPGLSLVRLLSSEGVMKAGFGIGNAAGKSAAGRYTLLRQ
jgi:hypothetical protein